MKITNKMGLPQALVDAVSIRQPSDSYSASMLTKSPRQVHLERRHAHEIERDVSDMIWSLFGTAVHKVIEQADPEQALLEEALTHELSNGAKITGTADLYESGKISDWKTVSVWSYVYLDDQKRFEYESQLNTYALLFELYGFPVRELEIVMLFRDWQKNKAKYNSDYPQQQVYPLPLKMWSAEHTERYLLDRTNLFESYKDVPDDDLPFCTDSERWAKPGKVAVMKRGRKSALRVLDTTEQAEAWMQQNSGEYIEQRPGEPWKRCEYCDAAAFCNQFQEGLHE